jgi:sensor histidine kinase YesM
MGSSKKIIKILAINTAFAFIPPILLLIISSDHVPLERLADSFLFSLIYAQSIGGLNFAIIPWVWGCVQPMQVWLRWSLRIGTIFATTFAGSMIACAVLLGLGFIHRELFWPQFWGSLKIAVFISLLASLSIGMYESMRWRLENTTLQLRTRELERERALKLATEAQLASLESRIHPHFLFNALNSISSLIPEDPQRAEKLVEQMAALLRLSLDSNQAGLVPLSAELKVVGDYLEIERARFGQRLRYRIEVAPELDTTKVPPLAVQTLVENSVKYGIAPNRAGGEICITGSKENGCLKIEVSDPGPAFALESAPAGHGLDNLTERVLTLFGQQGALALERRDDRNYTILSVPLNGASDARLSG